MIARWAQGRATVDQLLSGGRLTRVAANRALADDYLRQARQHLDSARSLEVKDPEGAFQLAYDAARKSLAAVLVNQGLRASGNGGHVTLYEAVRAQLDPPKGSGLAQFAWMRKLRNTTEYPDAGEKTADNADVKDALPAAQNILNLALGVLDVMPVY